ncbi:MAG TPA: hypothetical protein VHJ82_09195 [Actinomycetota bacterium]|nr:hypothetical protein [Actinomycetota bacterium]
MKRPTAALWAVNQLADAQPELIHELLDIQRSLRQPLDPSQLQELSRRRRRVVATLTKSAAKLLEDAGQPASDQTLKRVSNTLLAANTEHEEELLEQGRLQEELAPSGFEEAFGGLGALESAGDDSPSPAEVRREEEADALATEAKAAKRDADALAAEAASLRRQLELVEEQGAAARKKADDLARKAKSAAARVRRR